MLIIVDYAETRTELRALLQEVAADERRVRVLLLARSAVRGHVKVAAGGRVEVTAGGQFQSPLLFCASACRGEGCAPER